tara:strand:+ start:334 stop:1110 length:777 start_codon:yes stop_codon:yes gene_type:complete
MSSLLKISIITATYNSLETLPTTLKSIVEQNYENIECVVIDGKSTDGTLKIIYKYQIDNPDISFKIISEKDTGIYDALNKGIFNATGDIIGFLHSDDMLASSNILTKIAEEFIKTDVNGVYGDLQYVNRDNTNNVIRYWKSKKFHPKLIKQGWMPAHPTLFLKREVYKNQGYFDLSYKIAADYDLMLRILKDQTLKFSYLPTIITKMRLGGASNKSIKNIIKKTMEDYHAIRSNNIGGVITLLLKNISKIKQFLIKKT